MKLSLGYIYLSPSHFIIIKNYIEKLMFSIYIKSLKKIYLSNDKKVKIYLLLAWWN